MKTRYVLLTAAALAALVVWGVRPGQMETAAAAGDSGLLAMTVPGVNASEVIEPRSSTPEFRVIPASTAPTPSPRPTAVSGVLTLKPASRLWFDGSSSVKDFSCKAKTLTVPVSSLDCDNGTMNVREKVKVRFDLLLRD